MAKRLAVTKAELEEVTLGRNMQECCDRPAVGQRDRSCCSIIMYYHVLSACSDFPYAEECRFEEGELLSWHLRQRSQQICCAAGREGAAADADP